MSAIAGQLTMRAGIRRRNAATRDGYGHVSAAAEWQVVAEGVPCRVWVKSHNEVVDGKAVVVEEVGGVFRAGADVKREDELYELKDRRGREVFAGRFTVDAVSERQLGASQSHLQVTLRRHRG